MDTYNFNTSTAQSRSAERSLLTKTFLYMLGLLSITAVTSVIIHFILAASGLDVSSPVMSGPVFNAYITMLSCASITQIVLTVIMMFTSIKSGKITVPAILYALTMGVLISSFSFVLSWYTLTTCFGIAALCFGGMALIGVLSKNASGMGMVGMGLIMGVLMVSLFNIIMFLVLPRGAWLVQNIVTSIILVIAIMCITGYDVWMIKEISARGENSSNLAFYMAFNLYLDFIVIFIHIIRLVIMLTNTQNR